MKNKAIKVLSCLAVVALVGGVVIACNNNVSAESMGTEISMDDVKATETPVPTLTSTPSPTLEPTATATPIPTSTPTPTLTSTPIPTATVTPIPSENENTDEENTGNGEGISSNYTDGNRMDREEENAKIQEDIDKHTEELREESNKVAEEDKKNDNKSELDLSMFTDDDLKAVAEFAEISLDDLKHLSEDAFKELYTNWFISKSLNKYGGGNTGGSSSGNTGGSSNQQDDTFGNGWENPEDEWADDPNVSGFELSDPEEWMAGGM